jgi:tRNA-modifying protein YgfZ
MPQDYHQTEVIHSLAEQHTVVYSLDGWSLVNASGADCYHYLQGQLTLDINTLSATTHALSAHCDAKGKIWSSLRLFPRAEGISYLLRNSVMAKQMTELKKYAVFAKVTIAPEPTARIYGVAGPDASTMLAKFFHSVPDATTTCATDEDYSLLWFAEPIERFIVILHQAQHPFEQVIANQAIGNDSSWLALDIAAGLPIIEAATSEQLLPQAVNLQALGAISFKKGCYTGQEMVARAKYRGANKRALYWLAGPVADAKLPQLGDAIELQLGENWRKTGTVLHGAVSADATLHLQVVLNNDLSLESVFRPIGAKQCQLQIQPLPYTLLEE